MEPEVRDGALQKLLGKYHASRKNRVLVFVLYKKEAARMEKFLQASGSCYDERINCVLLWCATGGGLLSYKCSLFFG